MSLGLFETGSKGGMKLSLRISGSRGVWKREAMISPGFINLPSLPQKDSLHFEGTTRVPAPPLSFLALLPQASSMTASLEGTPQNFTHYYLHSKQMVFQMAGTLTHKL